MVSVAAVLESDDRLAEAVPRETAADRKLVDVRRIRGLLARERVAPEERQRRGGLTVDLDHVQLAELGS
jgi:hypothetical protein